MWIRISSSCSNCHSSSSSTYWYVLVYIEIFSVVRSVCINTCIAEPLVKTPEMLSISTCVIALEDDNL